MTDDEPVSNGDDEAEEMASNETDDTSDPENLDPDAGKSQQQIIDEMTGQLSFDF